MKPEEETARPDLTDDQSAVCGSVRVSLARIAPHTRFESHAHAAPHLCFVLDGGFREFNDDGMEACGTLGLRLSPANDRHRIVFGSTGARCLLVEIDGPKIASPRARSFVEDGRLGRCGLALCEEFRRGERSRVLRVEELALELLAGGLRRARPRAAVTPPDWLLRVRARLDAFDGGRPLSRDDFSSAADVHPTQVTRAFREHFGTTPAVYRARRRLERAVALISDTDRSLAMIAVDCGFADQSHMSRSFRTLLGHTPIQLRRRMRNGNLAAG